MKLLGQAPKVYRESAVHSPSLAQIQAFWPDIWRPFQELIPADCRLVFAEDLWSLDEEVRRRTIGIAPTSNAPPLDALLEEVCDDAIREGWTALHEEDEAPSFELENVLFYPRIDASQPESPSSAPTKTLRLQFAQPWPQEAGPGVETSEMFQKLVREMLSLGGEPERLEKSMVLDPDRQMRADRVLEVVEMPSTEDLRVHFRALSFAKPAEEDGYWISKEKSETYDITALVRQWNGRCEVTMLRTRRA